MEFEISLNDLEFYAYHGVMPEEKTLGNRYRVNVSIIVPVPKEMDKDNLQQTVSYVDIYEIVKEEMYKPVNLLETLSWKIVLSIQHKFPEVRSGKVKIEKLTPPIEGIIGSASVTLSF